MCKCGKKCMNLAGPTFILVLLLSCNIAYPQVRRIRTPINLVSRDVIIGLKQDIPPLLNDSIRKTFSRLRPLGHSSDRNTLFYDTLKVRASKNRFTKKLFDFLVKNPDTTFRRRFASTSDANYKKYIGIRIRKIVIRRLDVFGTDINYPYQVNPKNYEKILNKTHFNTTENIVRKNLLFKEGDEISPLKLSDNERFLRELPFIGDARIFVVLVSDQEADIVVFTKDIYSLGGDYVYRGLSRGTVSVFDKNILGWGHELGIDVPFDNRAPDSPGFGGHYNANNIQKTFIDLNAFYLNGLGNQSYGVALSRKLVSSNTKYAGGVSFRHMYSTVDFGSVPLPVPYKYNLQDYWVSRSFLFNRESVSRFIVGTRYINNNVYSHPLISSDSYFNLQKYKFFLGSAALSIQKYTKTNLLYSYGRTEDVPYGALIKITSGREYNEFKNRTYLASEGSFGNKNGDLGYFYFYSGLSVFINKNKTEQGLLAFRLNYFSNLLTFGNFRMRNFVYLNYTRGFGRYTNENLRFSTENGFSGFRNDSINGNQRLSISLESVVFSPLNIYGFRFAFFGFTDFAFLSGTNQVIDNGFVLSSIGVGMRIRNDNLIFNTLQIRFAFFPNPPIFSRISGITVSGEQLLHPDNFEPGQPAIIPYQ
jgi:hypothetical protein